MEYNQPSAFSCAKYPLIQEFEQEPAEAAEKISKPSASSASSCSKNLFIQEFEQKPRLGCALLLGLVLFGQPLSGADLPSPQPQSPAAAPMARKSEIKLFITAANVPQAIKALKLDEHRAVNQLCCFFDTSDGMLEAEHLILRARQKGDGPGEFTVKLRASEDSALSDAERAIQPEQDWTDEYQSKASGMGEPSGLTKTRMVLNFFKPGGP